MQNDKNYDFSDAEGQAWLKACESIQSQYQNNPQAATIPVHINNDGSLSETDQIDATQFAVSLINDLRTQIGVNPLVITKDAMLHNNQRVNQYNSENWNFHGVLPVYSGDPDMPSVTTKSDPAFSSDMWGEHAPNIGQWHLSAEVLDGSQGLQPVFSPNAKEGDTGHYNYSRTWATNRDQLHKAIYETIYGMIFTDGSQPGHAKVLLGLVPEGNEFSLQYNKYNQLVGNIEDQNYRDDSDLIPLSNTGYDTNAIKSAHDKLVEAQTNYDNFVKNNQSGDLDLSHIVSLQDYTDNKTKYDADPNGDWASTYKATMDQYEKQQTALKPYLDAISQAQTKLDQVYFAKTSDSKTDDHASQLASAKQALQNAQAKLATANAEASQADAALDSAQADAQKAADELKAAQDKLAHDQSSSMSLEQAQAELQKAQSTLAQKHANLADAKTAAQKAQAMQSQADSALASAKANAQKAQAALTNAQTKAKSAQARVNEFTGTDKAVAAAQDKLNAANESLQVAKSNHNTARENLIKAQDALKTAKSKLQAAQDAASKASQELAEAQNKAEKTKAALDKAKAELITDAKVYGNSVDIKNVTIHVDEAVPAPQITNPTADDPTQSLVMGAYLKMASSKLDTIPTGTTTAWSDLNQLNADAQIVGSYQEEALVFFPDGSTTMLNVPLTVLAAEKPVTPVTPVDPSEPVKPEDHTGDQSHTTVPTDHNQDQTDGQQPSGDTTNTTTSTDPTMPNDQKSNHKQSSANDRNVTVTPSHDATVNSEVNGDSNVTAKPIATDTNTNNSANIQLTTNGTANATTMPKRSDLNNGLLPQTGNKNEAGLIGLGVASVLGALGLAGTNKKRRNN